MSIKVLPLLLVLVVSTKASVANTFSDFKALVEDPSTAKIEIFGEIPYPCATELFREDSVNLTITSSTLRSVFVPENSTDSCFFSLLCLGRSSIRISDVSFAGNASLHFVDNTVVQLERVFLDARATVKNCPNVAVLDSEFRASFSLDAVTSLFFSGSDFFGGAVVKETNGEVFNCSFYGPTTVLGPHSNVSVLHSVFGPSSEGCLSVSSFSAVSIAHSSFFGKISGSNLANTSLDLSTVQMTCSDIAESGGALWLADIACSSIVLANVELSGCDALQAGGGLYFEGFAQTFVRISDSNFTNLGKIRPPQFGGAIFARDWSAGSSLMMESSSISKCDATSDGSLLYMEDFSGVNVDIVNVSMSRYSRAQNGGAVYAKKWTGGRLRFSSVVMEDGDVANAGGGMWLGDFSAVTVMLLSTSFHRLGQLGTIIQHGAAFHGEEWTSNGSLLLDSVVVSDCDSAKSAAGLDLSKFADTRLTIRNTTFSRLGRRTPPEDGTAIYAKDWTSGNILEIERLRISECEATHFGAGIAFKSIVGSTVLIDGIVIANVSQNTALEYGGGISFNQVTSIDVRITNATVQNSGNAAVSPLSGGAIYVSLAAECTFAMTVDLIDCESSVSGAGLYVQYLENSSLSLDHCTFSRLGGRRSPLSGGAMWIDEVHFSSISLASIVVEDSEARTSGGGIFVNILSSSRFFISNSTFVRLGQDSLPHSGAGLAATSLSAGSELSILNCTFENNTATTSGSHLFFQYVSERSFIVIKDVLLANNGVPLDSLFATNFDPGTFLHMSSSRDECSNCSGLQNGGIVLEASDARAEFVDSQLLTLVAKSWQGQITVDSVVFTQSGPIVNIQGSNLVSLSNLELKGKRSLSLQSIDRLSIANFTAAFQSATTTRGSCLSLSSVGQLEVLNSSFRDSRQTQECIGCGGGAIALEGVAGRFENVLFQNLSAAGVGGAVFVGGQSSIEFYNATWRNCRSLRNGGSIHLEGASTKIIHSRFENCRSESGDGGGISAYESSVTLENVSVHDVAADRGGFLSAFGCPLVTLRDVSASQCRARTSGGFLAFQAVDSVDLIRVTASITSAQKSGGALSFSTVKSSAHCFGNGVQLFSSSSAGTGGCIEMSESTCSFENSAFRNCSCPTNGGAARVHSLSSLFGTNLTIQGSTAENGGAVSASGHSTVVLARCMIENNQASLDGGGFMLSGASLFDTASVFDGNFASSHGGTIFATEAAVVGLNQSVVVRGNATKNGGAMYASEGSLATFTGSSFRSCLADSGGVLYIANDRRSSVLTVSYCSFSGNSAANEGGAIALIDQSSVLTFDAGNSFTENSASKGGAVFFATVLMPEGLNRSTHQDNRATEQGPFSASGPVTITVSPSRFLVPSSQWFSAEFQLHDFFGGVVADASDTCVKIEPASGDSVRVLGGSGSFSAGKATLSTLMLLEDPGTSGMLIASVEAYNLSVLIPYSLRECKVGEIAKDNQCIQCEYSTYALNKSAPSCSSCPDGAVCVNGSEVVPKWGYWKLPHSSGTTLGVCDQSDSCYLPSCLVNDACFGVRSMWIDVATNCATSSTCAFNVRSGYSRTVAAASAMGNTSVLVAERYWATFVALNCSHGVCRLFLQSDSAWPTWGAKTLEAQLFVSSRTCHEGYEGNLCSQCSSGYGRTSGAECGRCEDPWMTFLLAGAFLLVGIGVVAVMTWSTLRNADKKDSQLVTIAKVVWTFAQLMALCAELPMNWPSAIEGMFRVQDAASSVSSRQFFSLDCMLHHLGVDNGNSIVFHAIFVLLAPIMMILLAGLTYSCTSFGRKQGTYSVSAVDKFFVSCLTILFLLYPSLCRNAFELFPCQELSSGEPFMSFSLATACSGGSYTAAVAIGVAGVLLYAIGIPAFSFFLVWRKRRLLYTSYARSTVGFLYLGYRTQCYYYESILMVKKMLFGGIVLMSRWLGASVASSLSIVLFAGAYMLHVELKPFEDEGVDRLARLSLGGLILTVVCGQLFTRELGEAAGVCVLSGLLAVTLAFFAYAIFLVAPHLKAAQGFVREKIRNSKFLRARSAKNLQIEMRKLPMRRETLNPLRNEEVLGENQA